MSWNFSQQRFGGGEGSEADAVAAAAGEFLAEDVGEVGGVGGSGTMHGDAEFVVQGLAGTMRLWVRTTRAPIAFSRSRR